MMLEPGEGVAVVAGTSLAEPVRTRGRSGLMLGAAAVLCWSFGAALVFVGARDVGPWPFVAISSLAGGGLQMLCRCATHRELRSALCLPWRLWLIPLPCFVLYGLAWPLALASSSPKQVFGVSLLNYLWPILTVLFSAWWVPNARLNCRILLALLLTSAGMVLANSGPLREWVASGRHLGTGWLPYGLALTAAILWAAYSAVLARWQAWARDCVTSPLGFLLTGLIALVIAACTGSWGLHCPPAKLSWTLLYGAGPLAAGYLLWEVALHSAKVQTLSILAAATPVLATLLLCCFLGTAPGWEVATAACLVSLGVVLSLRD